MIAVNGYTHPTFAGSLDGEVLYGPDPYDYNYRLPVAFSRLETDRVVLTPLIPLLRVQLYFADISKDADIEKWLHVRHDTIEQLLRNLEAWRRNPNQLVLAIVDKGRHDGQAPNNVPGGSFAGIVGLIKTSAGNLSTEMGPVVTLPIFQPTYVTSSAVGLLLRYCLEVPANGGLGSRRVQWSTHPSNVALVQTAVRMGFEHEGVMRWTLPLPDEKKMGNGRLLREGDPKPGQPGLDTEVFAFYFDDWEAAGRGRVQALVDRQ